MMAFDAAAVLARFLSCARRHVDSEVESMEQLVAKLEKPARERACYRWPEGERWRELASPDFIGLKEMLDLLFDGSVEKTPDGRPVVLPPTEASHAKE